jgi:hypothetical protein
LIDWLIIYDFTSRSRIFHLYGDVTIAGKGLQNLGLYSALRAFEQGGIFIVPYLLWHGTPIFLVSSEGPPHLKSPLTIRMGMRKTYSNPDRHGDHKLEDWWYKLFFPNIMEIITDVLFILIKWIILTTQILIFHSIFHKNGR